MEALGISDKLFPSNADERIPENPEAEQENYNEDNDSTSNHSFLVVDTMKEEYLSDSYTVESDDLDYFVKVEPTIDVKDELDNNLERASNSECDSTKINNHKKVSKRSGRTTTVQFEKLMTFMENNPRLGKNKTSSNNSKQKSMLLWTVLKDELNCEAGPQKTILQWQSTWSDWKSSVKKKWRQISSEVTKTDDGPSYKKRLYPIEERLLAFIGNSAVDGDGETPEAGLQFQDDTSFASIPMPEWVESEMTMEDIPEIPRPSFSETENFQPSKKKRKINDEEILNNQKQQIQIYTNINKNLENINKSLDKKNDISNLILSSLIEQNNILKQIVEKLNNK